MKAGQRYGEVTGNIWSYAQRGDTTGVKAALARGVDANACNIAGWTPSHAAAAGGQVHILRLLIRHGGVDLTLRDRAGNQAAHQAALGGHAACLEELARAGADLSAVRLSGCKGAAARDLVAAATRKRTPRDADEPPVVGYARAQARSNAFFGPRRQPISCKIRREILKRKRRERHEKARDGAGAETTDGGVDADGDVPGDADDRADDPRASALGLERGYRDTVRAIKQNTKLSRGARRAKARADSSDAALAEAAAALALDEPDGTEDDDASDDDAAAAAGASAFGLLADSDSDSDDAAAAAGTSAFGLLADSEESGDSDGAGA